MPQRFRSWKACAINWKTVESAPIAAGLNSLSQTAAVWVEAAVSETLWAKLDLAGKTLDYKPEWIRLVQARSAATLIQKLQETIGS